MIRCMRALVMWSAASLSAIVVTPRSGEPSRFMTGLLEEPAIGLVEAGPLQVEVLQRAAGRDDPPGKLGPDVAVGFDLPAAFALLHHRPDAGRVLGDLGEIDAGCLDV